MNAAMNTNTSAGAKGAGGMLKTVLGFAFFIGVIVGLYYLYKFLYGSSASYADIALLDGSKSATATTTDSGTGQTFVSGTQLQGILDGGQYTSTFWIYVADTKGFATSTTPLAHLFEISNKRFVTPDANKGKTMLFVGLNPINGALVVRQNVDSDVTLNNAASFSPTPGSRNFPTSSLISGYNGPNSSIYQTDDDRCDIINGIEYQRWVMVTVIANGRTLDVYLDGKLARSCVYKANYNLGSSDGTAQAYFGLGNGGNLKGFFAGGKYYNYALTPDAVWALYQAGPSGYFTIGKFFKNLFNVDVSFESSGNLNP